MLKKLFKNKKFIFIFTFAVEMILYYFFEYNVIAGEYILPDIGIAPIFGLMFGPVGALGQASATLIFEIYDGLGLIGALIDFAIMFFVSIFTYKLWYTTFKRREINTPKFDSIYNIIKFIALLSIVSVVYWVLINLALAAYNPIYSIYPLTSNMYLLSYLLNIFNFSLIFGLLFISTFNILKIPMQSPKKWFTLTKIKYKYFLVAAVILLIYTLLYIYEIITNPIINNLFFIISTIMAVLFILNDFDTNIKIKTTNYSLIEQIILVFLILLGMVLVAINDNLKIFLQVIFGEIHLDFLTMITLAFGSILVFILAFIHIHQIEQIITNPIYDLIDSVNYYRENNKLPPKNNLNKYMKNEDDLSKFIKSFTTIDKKIENYMNDIEKTTAEKEKIETEFNIAHKIQSSMLKTNFNEFSKNKPIEIYGFMSPAREVGGDFYDYFDIDDENIAFVIGDVSGKGVPATLFMVKTMYLINNHSKFENKPEIIYENVNNILSKRNDESLFVTSWYGKFNFKTGKLTFVNAGHNPPLLKQENDKFNFMDINPNLILGGIDGIPYSEQELYLKPGDMVFLYTDGITEANNDYNGFYGEEKLKEILNENKDESLEKIIKNIKDSIDKHCENNAQFDDMTMLILKYKGENDE